MKKFLATVLAVSLAAVMVFGTALADTTLSEAGNAELDLSAAVEGDKLVITAECTEATAGTGWGVGGLCLAGDWTVTPDYEYKLEADPVVGEKIVVEYDAAAVKAAATGAVQVNFYNGYSVVSVVLKSAPAAGGDGGEQTADAMSIVLFAGVAAVAFVAVVASKKARA